ncbi:MAG TPA: YceI family protein, partial [Archangium sp.]
GDPRSLRLQLTADVASLTPDEPEARRRYHLPNTPLSDEQRASVKKHMLEEGQLDVARFPTISFQLTALRPGAEGTMICQGSLTLHGVTKPVTLAVKIEREGDLLRGKGKVRFNTSDFGIKPYSAALGLVRNKDEVELHARVVMKRQ